MNNTTAGLDPVRNLLKFILDPRFLLNFLVLVRIALGRNPWCLQ